MLWRILKYIQHQFYCKHRKGRGIHSPYLFEFIHEVVFNAGKTGTPEKILSIHRELSMDRTIIPTDSMGATSTLHRNGKIEGTQTVSSFVRGSSVKPKYGELLYRISHWLQPDMIIELGTGLGVSSLYLATGYPGASLTSFEGNRERAAFAAQLFCRNHFDNITIHWGELDQKLDDFIPLLAGKILAFVDANHHYEPTIRYIKALMDTAGDESVIIMDDIYWSKGMYKAWREIISWPEVKISIDLFYFGILLLRKDLQNVDLKINL